MKKKKETRQITVFVGVCIKKDKILICQRFEPECPDAHLKWELPGGKCDFGETPKEALKREFLEETGIEIKVERLIPFVHTHYWEYDWGIQQTLVMSCECTYVRKITKPHDHKIREVKWISIKELKNYELLIGTREILENLTS